MAKLRTVDFGARLRQLRMERGISQETLGKKIGLSQRMVAYYERQANIPPPGHVVARAAKVLGVTSDHLLGLKTLRIESTPRDVRLLRRLRKILHLPRHHQRAILEHLDALVTKTNGNGRRIS